MSALTGRTEHHLCSSSDAAAIDARVHKDAFEPFRRLRAEAQRAGFEFRILSGYRSFDQQLSIWNRKASGDLAVLDSNAAPVDIGTLSAEDLMFAILRWSALPGASRHHWGTDLDVYDATATPDGYEIELIPEEVNSGGMFGPLHEWLDERIANDTAFGFFRPYDVDREGVAPERWHLSYAPVAEVYLQRFTPGVLRKAVVESDMRLKETVVPLIDEIHERFVTNVNGP